MEPRIGTNPVKGIRERMASPVVSATRLVCKDFLAERSI